MKCPTCDLLDQAARVADQSRPDPLHRAHEILLLIGSGCALTRAALILPPSADGAPGRMLMAPGPNRLQPLLPDLEPGSWSPSEVRPHSREGSFWLPLPGPSRGGFLVLTPAEPMATASSCLPGWPQLAFLLGTLLERTPGLGHLPRPFPAWGTALIEALDRFTNLPDLAQALLPLVQRATGAAAVLLRPLHGQTVLGRPYFRIAGELQPLRQRLLEREEKLTREILGRGEAVFERVEAGLPHLAALPLLASGRTQGILTLWSRPEAVETPDFPASRQPLLDLAALIGQALERLSLQEELAVQHLETDRKLREATLLHRLSRAMYSTLRLDELTHLTLSAATVPWGGDFERAMLFLANERTEVLQGMLGVTRRTAEDVLPTGSDPGGWDQLVISPEARECQRHSAFNRLVKKRRLSLDPADNPLARAVHLKRVLFIARPEAEAGSGGELAADLKLAPYACAPLHGRDGPLGVLVVDNPRSRETIGLDRLRFLEVFAAQAGAAIENSMLVNRLETAHQDLRDTQERLIQGEKMAVLGEMAASVAHELKNPLVAIGGFAQRLDRSLPSGSSDKEYAAIIAREVRRMEELLSNILTFSRRQILCLEKCSLREILDGALDLENHALARQGIRVVREIPQSLPTLLADAQKLGQVVVNLIGNARQAMPGGGELTLRAYATTLRGKPAVGLEVEDTGGGIPPEVLRNIFNPFFTTKEKGTGLGLSISHRIIEHHQGEIEVQNREGGAAFILRLPLRPSGAPGG